MQIKQTNIKNEYISVIITQNAPDCRNRWNFCHDFLFLCFQSCTNYTNSYNTLSMSWSQTCTNVYHLTNHFWVTTYFTSCVYRNISGFRFSEEKKELNSEFEINLTMVWQNMRRKRKGKGLFNMEAMGSSINRSLRDNCPPSSLHLPHMAFDHRRLIDHNSVSVI